MKWMHVGTLLTLFLAPAIASLGDEEPLLTGNETFRGDILRIEEMVLPTDEGIARRVQELDFGKGGVLEERRIFADNGQPEYIVRYEYDQAGRLVASGRYEWPTKLLRSVTYFYDADGALQAELWTDSWGAPVQRIVYTRDAISRGVVKSYADACGVLRDRYIYRFDAGGKLVDYEAMRPDGSIRFVAQVSYDTSRTRPSWEQPSTGPGNDLRDSYEHVIYNSLGQIAAWARWDRGGGQQAVYEYDEHGNWVCRNDYGYVDADAGGWVLVQTTYRKIVYLSGQNALESRYRASE